MPTTFTQESDFRKEREFGQKISAAFEFIRAHWRPLGRVLLYTVLPAALLHSLLNSTLQATLWGNLANRPEGIEGAQRQMAAVSNMMGSPIYWLNMVFSLAFVSLLILSIYGYLLCCLRQEGSQQDQAGQPVVTASDVWAVIRREFLGTYFSIFGIYLLVIVGFVFLVIPGIYLAVMLSLFFIVKLVEGTGFGATVSRCWHLIKGKWWSTAGLIFVMMLLLYALILLPSLLAGVLGGGFAALVQNNGLQLPVFAIIFTTLTTLISLFFYPPLLLVLAFQYFNLVERREGVGLRSLVGQLGQAAPTVPNASLRADEEGEY